MAEAVSPNFEMIAWIGAATTKGTPKPIIDRLHGELVKVIRSKEFGEILTREGATPGGNTPAELDKVIRADLAKWAKVVKESGIKAE